LGQTLTGGGGADTLVGYAGGGTTFADTAKNLTASTIQGLMYGDTIDIKDMAPLPGSFKFT
jgi:Ca2+-binding RTX toxin-like protein